MQRKLQRQPEWALNTKYQTMNIYQYHLIGRANDTCHFEVRDVWGHRTFSDFALQTKVWWSKNVHDEGRCPDQIILGAGDPSWCVLIHMVVYLESFLEKHPNSKYLFTDSMIETGPNNRGQINWERLYGLILNSGMHRQSWTMMVVLELTAIESLLPILWLNRGALVSKWRFVDNGRWQQGSKWWFTLTSRRTEIEKNWNLELELNEL